MQVGDLINFKQISAVPPYSRDGEWRIGLLLEFPISGKCIPCDCGTVLYEGRVYEIRIENMRKLEHKI